MKDSYICAKGGIQQVAATYSIIAVSRPTIKRTDQVYAIQQHVGDTKTKTKLAMINSTPMVTR